MVEAIVRQERKNTAHCDSKAKESAKIGENTLQKGGGSSAASDNASSPKRRTNDGEEKEIALLSPACASLDQFKSYAQRGEEFKKCVAALAD